MNDSIYNVLAALGAVALLAILARSAISQIFGKRPPAKTNDGKLSDEDRAKIVAEAKERIEIRKALANLK